jgi:hypothetical protein
METSSLFIASLTSFLEVYEICRLGLDTFIVIEGAQE